jgi:hypothetical protein
MACDILRVIALSLYLGTLTYVWVVSLADCKLTPQPGLPASTAYVGSEFDKGPLPLGRVFPNR